MDAFDFAPEEPEERPQRSCSDVILRLGAYYFIAATLLLIGYFVVIYLNPQSSLNPFPPAPQAAQAEPPTPPTATADLPPTETLAPSDTAVPSPTFTATLEPSTSTPTITNTTEPYPTATNVILVTDTPGPTVSVVRHFSAQENTPVYLSYSGGCGGLYIAGNVTDLNNQPIAFMIVRVTGTLGGEVITAETLSGSNTDYSESGWQIQISDTLLNSNQMLSVALYEQGGFDPVSDVIFFDTFASCTQNLVIVNFVQDQ